MTTKKRPKPKALTPEQRLIAAHMHLISNTDQHAISGSLGVNPGRVAEAIVAVRLAINDPKGVAKAVKAMKESNDATRT